MSLNNHQTLKRKTEESQQQYSIKFQRLNSSFTLASKHSKTDMDSYDQFKFIDYEGKPSVSVDTNTVYYPNENHKIEIGNKYSLNCKCDATKKEFKLKNTFQCDSCFKLHQYECSTQDERDIIANDYYRTGNNKCLACQYDWN